jgi:23S rRNA pseudouridine2604 synthase
MTGAKRKTLSLPARADGDPLPLNPRRKPVRGGPATGRRAPVKANAEKPESEAKIDWRRRSQEKKKGERTPRKDSGTLPAARGLPPPRKTESAAGRPQGEDKSRRMEPAAAAAEVRVSKLMSERGLCSRREADEFIERGWVYVDGERVVTLGTRVAPTAKITLDKQAQAAQQRQATILLHKPVGYVSGQPEPGCQPAMMLIRPENRQRLPDAPPFHFSHLKGLAPAGRLDIDSTGILVFTQDGRVARQLIGENSKIEKEYLVRVEGPLADDGLAKLRHGLELDGKPLKPARVEWLNDDQLRFILNEGRKRQIRRMCELVGLRVTALKRVRIGKVRLGNLPPGQWRYLREDETF